ncbi:hypothetical protein ILUMI_13245 [Ignelater luminosus]|uniref:Neurotransmitter-gated ion-channel ligand-binding domain-containing protein n=1 Tax=Ignelater luminosus TaxID=2038154 RepID=A0A8K0CX23_IGNLU|nr:hypothetical protein ILUMI_13245 [Ignelater luminosus]
MKSEFVDCFMLIGTALSLNPTQKLPEMGRPLLHTLNEATTVNVSLTVEEINFINLKTMEVEVIFQLHQRWIDPRLGANLRTHKMAVAGQIWRPKITVTKGLIGSGINNEDTQFWRGFGDRGNVLLSEKMFIKTFCTRNLRKFPFDTQICELKFGTYRFPMDEVQLFWHSNPAELFTGINLHEFKLINISTYHEVEIRQTGNFSVLVLQIIVERYYVHYLICTMIPCTILVLLSYISFWINYKSINVRLVLSMSVILFLIYLYQEATCLTISVPFLKSLDFFIILCLTFAGFSLFENCIISYISSNMDLNCMVEGIKCIDEKVYDKLLLWIERSVKVIFPIFYFCCLLVFLYCTL